MTAEDNLKTMQEEYGLLLYAEVSQKVLQTIVLRMLKREIQHEEAMRDIINRPTQQGETL